MAQNLDQIAAAACWEDVEKLVYHTVWAFRKQYGGDFDELFGEAQIAFMEGFHAFCNGENNSPDFATEIRRWVWYELFDAWRTRTGLRRKGQRRIVEEPDEYFMGNVVDDYVVVNRLELEDELSADGRVVLALVLDTPPDIAAVAVARGGHAGNWRSVIRGHLAGPLAWDKGRIDAAFAEVKQAMWPSQPQA